MAMQWSPEDWARVGRQLRTWREANGYSRRELAERAGVSEKSIQLAEEGRVPKGRWPQSLTAIERGLNWHEGRIEAMLDASDQPHLYDDPVVMRDGKPTFIHDGEPVDIFEQSVPEEEVSRAQAREGRDASEAVPFSYPPEIEHALPAVTFFASNCVAHGAPEWLGVAYENAVAALLQSLSDQAASPPQGVPLYRRRRGYSVESSGYSAQRPGYSIDRPGLGRDPLRRAAAASSSYGPYEAFGKLSRETASYQASLQRFAQQSSVGRLGQSVSSRAMEQITRQNEQYRQMLAGLSAPARQAAVRDLRNSLESILEEEGEAEEER